MKRESVLDYGCGYGYFFEYLTRCGYADLAYTGMDLSAAMVEKGQELYGGQGAQFLCSTDIEDSYDYIVASGIFNVKQDMPFDEWTKYVIDRVNVFAAHSRRGFAFNCLTKYSDADKMQDYLYYADPCFFFDYAKRHFSRNVALLHDYGLWEFTLLVRK